MRRTEEVARQILSFLGLLNNRVEKSHLFLLTPVDRSHWLHASPSICRVINMVLDGRWSYGRNEAGKSICQKCAINHGRQLITKQLHIAHLLQLLFRLECKGKFSIHLVRVGFLNTYRILRDIGPSRECWLRQIFHPCAKDLNCVPCVHHSVSVHTASSMNRVRDSDHDKYF